jgi:hypothetical protein
MDVMGCNTQKQRGFGVFEKRLGKQDAGGTVPTKIAIFVASCAFGNDVRALKERSPTGVGGAGQQRRAGRNKGITAGFG